MKLQSLLYTVALVLAAAIPAIAGDQFKYMAITCTNTDCSKHEARDLKEKREVTLAAGMNTKQLDATKYEKPVADLLKVYTDKNWTLIGNVQDADGHQVFYLKTPVTTNTGK